MKKIIIVLLVICLLVTGCSKSNKKVLKEASNEVEKEVINFDSVNENKIEESFNYIKDNIFEKNYDKDKVSYHTKYLLYIGERTSRNENNPLYELSLSLNRYLENNNKKDKDLIEDLLVKIKNNLKDYSYDYYINYQIVDKIEDKIRNNKEDALADLNDENYLNYNNVDKMVKYIRNHYNDALEDEEVVNKITYYMIFLSNLNKEDNDVVKLGKSLEKYLNTLDNKDKKDLEAILELVTEEDISALFN